MTTDTSPGGSMKRLMALFEEAVGLSADEQADFLTKLRADEPTLTDELESLLGACDPTNDFLMPLDVGRAAAMLGMHEQEDKTGTQIGAYKLLRELGRGGMGVVYVAERVDGQFNQQVALKLIRRGMDSDEILRRFLIERQILAQLDHPNIARLLDGGITPDGQPYFAMEYVKGAPLLAYCERRRPTIAERLTIFHAVCRAVHHAHTNMVVHRDIKPSNILVTDEGAPKLLDFGIAKLLDPGLSARAGQLTRTAARPLTPEYASPEQLRGGPVTTASDVYQLGLLLYRLLTGQSPYADTTGDSHATVRAICEVAPPKPSSVVTDDIAAAYGLSSKRLTRRLSGDLDNIVLMALRKEPERRYESAAQLADDVEHHLANRPVLAQRASPVYRAAKFAQRHKFGTAASVVVVLALIAGIAGTTWQARVAADEAVRAAQLKEFALDLLELSDPDAARGHNLTVTDLLATGSERVEAELAGQPELQSQMLVVLGTVHRKLGNYDVARPALERALALRRSIFGPRDLPVAESLNELGKLHYQSNDYAPAEALFREALTIRRDRLGDNHIDVADVLNSLGSVVGSRGDFDKAERLLEESLAIRRLRLGPGHPLVAESLTALGILERHRDALALAQDYHEQALAIRRATFGERHYRVADSLKNLALVFHSRGNMIAAEQRYREALAIQKVVLGADHPAIATTHNSLASLLREVRQLDEAQHHFERAVAIQRATLGDDDPAVARTLTNFGALLFDLGSFEASVATQREALAIKQRTLPPDHPSTATSLNNLASLLGDMERADEAWPLAAQAADIYRRRLGPSHTFFGIALMNQARFELDAGLFAEAESHAVEAREVLFSNTSDEETVRAIIQLRLGEVYLKTDRTAQALPLLRDAVERFRAMATPHKLTAESENALGAALSVLGEVDEAEALLVASHSELDSRGARVRRQALNRLVAHYRSVGDAASADRYAARLNASTTPQAVD